MEHILYQVKRRRIKMTFKEFKKLYYEKDRPKIKYIRLDTTWWEKPIYAIFEGIYDFDERYDEKEREWYDSEWYTLLEFEDRLGTSYEIEEEDVKDIKLSNEKEFNENPYYNPWSN